MLRMMGFILLAFPLLDISLTYLAGQWLGGGVWLWVLAALPLGMLLIRHHWVGLLPQLLASVQRGDAPLPLLLGGLRVGITGLLLMMPGILSDALAVLLLLPVWPRLQPATAPIQQDGIYEGEYSQVSDPDKRLLP